jgi:hypothetical protein
MMAGTRYSGHLSCVRRAKPSSSTKSGEAISSFGEAALAGCVFMFKLALGFHLPNIVVIKLL